MALQYPRPAARKRLIARRMLKKSFSRTVKGETYLLEALIADGA